MKNLSMVLKRQAREYEFEEILGYELKKNKWYEIVFNFDCTESQCQVENDLYKFEVSISATELCTSKRISVNLSLESFNSPIFNKIFKKIISERIVKFKKICIEFSESDIYLDLNESAIELLFELKYMGCTFAINNFLNGCTNWRLINLGLIDYVKINYGELNGSLLQKKIIDKMLEMRNMLGIEIVASRVDSNESYNEAKKLGAHHFQGKNLEGKY